MEEIWKDIENYEGLYQVSNMGRVKSLGNNKTKKEKILKLKKQDTRPLITLHKDNTRKTFVVSRIVATAFIPNPENKTEVDHIDTNTFNNCATNLKWVNHIENMRNTTTLTHRTVIPIPVVQLTTDGTFVNYFESGEEAKLKTGVCNRGISLCCNNKRKTAGGYRWLFFNEWMDLY